LAVLRTQDSNLEASRSRIAASRRRRRSEATAASGHSSLPTIDPELLTAAADAVEPEDVAILGMLVHGLSRPEICDALRIQPAQLRERRVRMLAALRSPAAG
jgi:hypothetical protein